ncbi:hypothetical protein ABZ756_04940 [Mammaliicoccus sciuri]|uniref:hypothetical protein n=1 Tax=Sporosarcina TaxID=1569 RepID=UPI001C8D6700|nr:hypothetical protein [Sporosarcina aquimarina]MBY0223098.1 hypothetical protein [Sporosarcina aquimarina]
MTESGKDLLKNELKKLIPEIEHLNGILDQVEINVVDNNTTYEVKEVNKQELEAIKRSALSKDGRFEKNESNESRKNIGILNEIRNNLTSLDKKMDIIIQYLEAKG